MKALGLVQLIKGAVRLVRTFGLIEICSKIEEEEAIETTGTNYANNQIALDEDLPDNAPSRVRVIVRHEDNESNGRSNKRRKAASAEGLKKMSDDFDGPLEGFEDYQRVSDCPKLKRRQFDKKHFLCLIKL